MNVQNPELELALLDYAQKRANETKRSYLVSYYGRTKLAMHSLMNCKHNRELLSSFCEVYVVVKPTN